MKVKRGLDYFRKIDRKRLLMSVLTFVVIIMVLFAGYKILRFILSASRTYNFIDLDMIETDGSLDERKIFDELERQRRVSEKNYKREKF